jgi:hypothetical protein
MEQAVCLWRVCLPGHSFVFHLAHIFLDGKHHQCQRLNAIKRRFNFLHLLGRYIHTTSEWEKKGKNMKYGIFVSQPTSQKCSPVMSFGMIDEMVCCAAFALLKWEISHNIK